MFIMLLTFSSTAFADRTDINRITLINEDIMSGTVLTNIKLKTMYGELEFTPEIIQKIIFEISPNYLDQVILKVGDRMSGNILNKDVTIRMSNGVSITIDKDKIKFVEFLKSVR